MTATRSTILLVLLCFITPAGAALRQSGGNGRWDRIVWYPAGVPVAGDSVVIAHSVDGLPSGIYPLLRVGPGAALRLDPRSGIETAMLVNAGTIELGAGSVLRVTDRLVNTGEIAGDGITMMAAPARLAGAGAIGHLLVGGIPGSAVYFESSSTLGTLTIERGNSVEIGASDLTIDGGYYSRSPWGVDGIRATSGTIRLNGAVRGTARGTVVLGEPASRPRSKTPPIIDGVIGDTGRTIIVDGERDVMFSTFIGDVTINRDGALRAVGIGAQGRNGILGTLRLFGRISAIEPTHIWEIHGDVANRGIIGSGTIMMHGDSLCLDNRLGAWNPDASLSFRGRTNGSLAILGDLALSRLDIGAATDGDSNIVVDAGGFPMRIRHQFTSDIGRACRLRSDTLVRVRGGCVGWIDADIRFEGFSGRAIAGRFGGDRREVRITVPRAIDASASFTGQLVQEQRGTVVVTGSMSTAGYARFNGMLTLDSAAELHAGGRLELPWIVRGGGRIRFAGGLDTFDASGAVVDSVTVEVGTDSTASTLLATHAVTLPRLWLHAGSRLYASELEPISAGDRFQYDVVHTAGWQRASAAVVPVDPLPAHYFGIGASAVYSFDGSAYRIADTIRVGEGVWMHMPVETTIPHRGRITPLRIMISVHENWNLIGPGTFAAETRAVTCRGCTIESEFFDTASNTVTTLEPGHGYWVKVSGNGTMTIGE